MKTIVQRIQDGEIPFSEETADDIFINAQNDFADLDLELEDYIGISSQELSDIMFGKSNFFKEVSKRLKGTRKKLVASVSENA